MTKAESMFRNVAFRIALVATLLVGASASADELFPKELVEFKPYAQNPVFKAEGPGHWDVKIRERGAILHDAKGYHLWFTGYDGMRTGKKLLGYATSADGIQWKRISGDPIYSKHWVEDMTVVKNNGYYYMFAEGEGDAAQLLTSNDRTRWTRIGALDIRTTTGAVVPPPFGTPTVWIENGTWYLYYEKSDLGVWLATSTDLKVWKNVQDEPVLKIGPDSYDKAQVAFNQVFKYKGRYYACYHGSPGGEKPYKWTSNIATSTDLIHWTKYAGNPLTTAEQNKSSNQLVFDGKQFRMYTTHEQVDLYLPK